MSVIAESDLHDAVRACAASPEAQEATLRSILASDARAILLRDSYGRTPLAVALELKSEAAIRVLLDAGAARTIFAAAAGPASLLCMLPHAMGGHSATTKLPRDIATIVDAAFEEHITQLGLSERNRVCCPGTEAPSPPPASGGSTGTPARSNKTRLLVVRLCKNLPFLWGLHSE